VLVFVLLESRGRLLAAFAALGRPGFVFGVAVGLDISCYLIALCMTSDAHVAIIYASLLLVAGALGFLMLGERVGAATLLVSLAAFAGLIAAMADAGSEGSLACDLLAVGMTLLSAATIVLARRHRAIPMIPAALLAALVALAGSLPFAAPTHVAARTMRYLAVFGSTNMGLGLNLFAICCKHLPASETALVNAPEVPLLSLWVWLALGETPLLTTLASGALVMAAVFGGALIGGRRPVSAADLS
jgi:drug/metabolite transporter (DMT)-like permease